MKVTILGGGFGLYGYLPALFKLSNVSIFLPMRYQKYFKLRDDLSSFFDNIEWIDDNVNLLKICEVIIIALPPAQQYACVKKCLNYKNISHLLLEKPLAITPHLANELIDNLKYSKKNFELLIIFDIQIGVKIYFNVQ